MLLEGKTAIVTGASGGFGKAVAIALAKEGAAVAVHFHGNEEKALLVKKEIEEAGGKAEIFRANVADFEECNALVKAAAKTFGSIDIFAKALLSRLSGLWNPAIIITFVGDAIILPNSLAFCTVKSVRGLTTLTLLKLSELTGARVPNGSESCTLICTGA